MRYVACAAGVPVLHLDGETEWEALEHLFRIFEGGRLKARWVRGYVFARIGIDTLVIVRWPGRFNLN